MRLHGGTATAACAHAGYKWTSASYSRTWVRTSSTDLASPPCSFPWSPIGSLEPCVCSAAPPVGGAFRRCLLLEGVDVLSHQKKAAFWRELVELFPNIIDYLCNPNVNPVRHKIKISRFRVQACVASATLLTDGTGWMLRARFRARVSTFGFWFALVALLSRRSRC